MWPDHQDSSELLSDSSGSQGQRFPFPRILKGVVELRKCFVFKTELQTLFIFSQLKSFFCLGSNPKSQLGIW